MLGIHAYIPNWKRDQNIVSLLTWATSIVSWNNIYGNLRLLTTDEGHRDVVKKGLDKLYRGNIDTSIGSKSLVKSELHRKSFWASAKLSAIQDIKQTPCCFIDLDAILWNDLPDFKYDVAFVHVDDRFAPAYVTNRKFFQKMLPKEFKESWIWEINPICTGFFSVRDPELLKLYQGTMKVLIKNISYKMSVEQLEKLDVMRFVEQRLLALCVGVLRKDMYPLSQLTNDSTLTNPWVSHLGGSRYRYPLLWEAQRRYCTWLIRFLKKFSKEDAGQVIETAEKEIARRDSMVDANVKEEQKFISRFHPPVYENIEGLMYVKDPNLPLFQRVEGRVVQFIGETIHLVEGSCVRCFGGTRETLRNPDKQELSYTTSEKLLPEFSRLFSRIGDI